MTIEYWNKVKSLVKWLVSFLAAVFLLFGCAPADGTGSQSTAAVPAEAAGQTFSESALETGETERAEAESESQSPAVLEDGSYTTKAEVALYIHLYNKLPENYITKKEAEKAGWVSKEGNLWEVAPGKSIGGSRFGNYEGALPEKDGRTWYECDINFDGSYRGAERIIYSSDGLIYYTGDHYKTFEELY